MSEASKAPCIADELETLTSGWNRRADCESDTAECRQLCIDGDSHACFSRGLAFQRSTSAKIEAQTFFLRACKLGLATGCTNWAAGEWMTETAHPSQCLQRVFEKTCAAGDPWGCGMVGRLLIDDSKTPIDLVRGRVFLTLACVQNAATCNLLAMYLDDDTLGPPDPARASELRTIACADGNVDSCPQVVNDASPESD